MGCGGSIVLDFVPTDICGQGPEVFEICRMMDLTPTHLGVLFMAYIDIDSDASGFIQTSELASYFGLEDNERINLALCCFDADRSGVLSFVEFVVLLYSMCSTDDRKLSEFFYFMNFPKRGEMASGDKVILSFEAMYGQKIRHTPAMDVLRNYEARQASVKDYSIRDYIDMCAMKSSLMNPLSVDIRRMQVRIFGAAFWGDLMERRRMDPLRNSVDFLYSIRDKITQINHRIEKKKRMMEWKNKIHALTTKRKPGITGQQRVRKQSVLLAFFSDVTEVAESGSKAKNKYHYSDAKHKESSSENDEGLGAGTMKPRRRASLLKPNLNFSIGADGKAKVGSRTGGGKNGKVISKGGGKDMSRGKKKRQ